MPSPPIGEAQLRGVATHITTIDTTIRTLIREAAAGGPKRDLLTQALTLLITLRRADLEGPVAAAYLAVHPTGRIDAVSDLAAALTKRIYIACVVTSDSVKQAMKQATNDNAEEMANAAVVAHVDKRGTQWTLAPYGQMVTDTTGRTATSRGLTDDLGQGGKIIIEATGCPYCETFAGDGTIGEVQLPPYHPGCQCIAVRA